MQHSEPTDRVAVALRRSPKERDAEYEERAGELRALCEAAGGVVVAEIAQERPDVDAALYLGSGKVTQIAEIVAQSEIDVVVFDDELSPAHLRNLENRIGCRVIDRTQLILDIFAMRAKSSEGRIQVEIAQLEYLLPRLTGRGVEMSRLGGGIGTRGPGETKLEMDRRRIRQRISQLRSQLREIRRTREVQRSKRAKSTPVAALVGYTNAGKTTLLQRWTTDRGTGNADAGHARLFDTLDPVARRVKAGVQGEMVLLDTVGFVQNLPHLLVDAFRATLEEVLAADVVVHVVDGLRDPNGHLSTTYQVLREIGALDKPVVTFFNKMDAAQDRPAPDNSAVRTIYGSARTGEGVDELYSAVEQLVRLDAVQVVIDGRADSGDFWQRVVKTGKVVSLDPLSGDQVRVTLEVERRVAERLHWKGEGVDLP